MKLFFILISLLFFFISFSFKNDTEIVKASISIEENYLVEDLTEIEQEKTTNCSINDFLILKEKNIQQDFFKKIDSVFVIQYPNPKDRESSINITPEILNKYLRDIDKQSLKDSLVVFEDVTLANKEYHFKFIPKSFNQWKTSNYKNNIYIRHSAKDCSFSLYINYSCLIDFEGDEDDVVEEHLIFYYFRIINGKIVDFGRNEVG